MIAAPHQVYQTVHIVRRNKEFELTITSTVNHLILATRNSQNSILVAYTATSTEQNGQMFMNLQKTLNEKKTGDNVPIILGYTLYMPHFGGCLREKNKKGATSTYS